MTKPLVKPKKKLTPASICAQNAWGKMSLGVKKELRNVLPDHDRDGVPTGFDCKPKNRKKQEFTSSDKMYLKSNKNMKLGKKIGTGGYGEVYEVEGNSKFVVKIPNDFVYATDYVNEVEFDHPDHSVLYEKKRYIRNNTDLIRKEYKSYRDLGLSKEKLFIPTKAVRITVDGLHTVGLVRPKITTIFDNTRTVTSSEKRMMTDSKLRELHNELTRLTRQGYMFADGLQLGLDSKGRSLVYDLGDIERYGPESNLPYTINNKAWARLLERLGKTKSQQARYAEIKR